MKNAIKVLAVVSSIPLLVLGLKAMFAPTSMFELFDLNPHGVFGLNTIRADLGGMLVTGAVMIYIGIWKQNSTWFLATSLLMATLLVGRMVSFIADGWTNAAIPAVVVELIAIAVMVLAYTRLNYSTK